MSIPKDWEAIQKVGKRLIETVLYPVTREKAYKYRI